MEERQASRQHRVILTNRGTCALNGISDILSFDVNEILLETEMGMADDPGDRSACEPADSGKRRGGSVWKN